MLQLDRDYKERPWIFWILIITIYLLVILGLILPLVLTFAEGNLKFDLVTGTYNANLDRSTLPGINLISVYIFTAFTYVTYLLETIIMGKTLPTIRHLYPEMEPIRQQNQGNDLAAIVEKIKNIWKKANLNFAGPLYKRSLLLGPIALSFQSKADIFLETQYIIKLMQEA